MPTTWSRRSHAEHYLLTHPPARPQFYPTRRATPRPVTVIHTAENTPDVVATDGGAEAVARYISIRDTPGSYASIVDSDSTLPLIPFWFTAFHDGTGSNPWSVGLCIATTAAWWPLAPAKWRDGAIRNLAREAAQVSAWHQSEGRGVVRARLITKAQSDAGESGFISHALRDPARRSDPGAAFPWALFLAWYIEELAALGLTDPHNPHPPAGDDMPLTEQNIEDIAKRVGAELGIDRIRIDLMRTDVAAIRKTLTTKGPGTVAGKLAELRGWGAANAVATTTLADLLDRPLTAPLLRAQRAAGKGLARLRDVATSETA